MRKLIIRGFAALAALIVVIGLSACDPTSSSPQQKEQATGQSNYQTLQEKEPAVNGTYPVNRKTINFYTKTWETGAKNAYLYIMDGKDVTSYAVLEGPPVSMCTSLRPPYAFEKHDMGEYSGDFMVPAPGTDGVYYSGGECTTYYGKDATTGAFIEFTVGQSQSFILRDQPFTPDSVKGAVNLANGKTK